MVTEDLQTEDKDPRYRVRPVPRKFTFWTYLLEDVHHDTMWIVERPIYCCYTDRPLKDCWHKVKTFHTQADAMGWAVRAMFRDKAERAKYLEGVRTRRENEEASLAQAIIIHNWEDGEKEELYDE